MTPEQLEEIPGIGEKTLEKISTAVRHYFGQYEEGEERPEAPAPAATAEGEECSPNAADLAAVEADMSLDEERAKLDAELGEELDALKVDDADGGEEPASADGSGDIADQIARERIEELTESGDYDAGEVGVLPQEAGNDDTSARLRRQNPSKSPLPGGEAEEEAVLPDAERQEEDGGV
jgi:transcription termination/antitermination protein NusA